MSASLIIRQLGLQSYQLVSHAMRSFTDTRNDNSLDELWLVQHPQVFTQGTTGQAKHLLHSVNIPVIQSDRGGQITFHGPGQQIMYVLLDLRRYKLKVNNLVSLLEQTVIDSLACFNILAHIRSHAPGVYVGSKKICSFGLRIRKGYCFHGLALNVAMDLSPFLNINPCGHVGLRMTQVSNLSPSTDIDDITPVLMVESLRLLNIKTFKIQKWDPLNYVL